MKTQALAALLTLAFSGLLHAQDARPTARSEPERATAPATSQLAARGIDRAAPADARKGHVVPVTARTVSKDPYDTPLFLNAKTLRM